MLRHSLAQHAAHRIEVALEEAVHYRAALHRHPFLHLGLPVFHHHGVHQVEVEVAFSDRGGQYLAVAAVDVAASRGIGAQARLALLAAGAPFVAVHKLYIDNVGHHRHPDTKRQQQVEGHHSTRHARIFMFIMLFIFH